MQIYMYLQGRQTDTGSFFFAPSQKLGHILAQIHPQKPRISVIYCAPCDDKTILAPLCIDLRL